MLIAFNGQRLRRVKNCTPKSMQRGPECALVAVPLPACLPLPHLFASAATDNSFLFYFAYVAIAVAAVAVAVAESQVAPR